MRRSTSAWVRGPHTGTTEGLILLADRLPLMVTALHTRKVHLVSVQCIPTGNNNGVVGKLLAVAAKLSTHDNRSSCKWCGQGKLDLIDERRDPNFPQPAHGLPCAEMRRSRVRQAHNCLNRLVKGVFWGHGGQAIMTAGPKHLLVA